MGGDEEREEGESERGERESREISAGFSSELVVFFVFNMRNYVMSFSTLGFICLFIVIIIVRWI